jgi:hypothetical protein
MGDAKAIPIEQDSDDEDADIKYPEECRVLDIM